MCIYFMRIYKEAQPKIRTSVELSEEFYKSCKVHHIKFAEAMRVGVSMILAERGVAEYDNRLNLHRKMRYFQQQAEEALQQLEILSEKVIAGPKD